MCGIVGIHNLGPNSAIDQNQLLRMMALVHHRGPDEAGLYLDDRIGLGHKRLSILDLMSGSQPIHNEDHTLWIVYNGEVFNYLELKADLEDKGHRFYTSTDTEVIVHLYEEYGVDCLSRLNGQFAIALWDSNAQSLLLARDRLGIRPLHYTRCGNRLLFGSEIKAIFADPEVPRHLDALALNQVFTFWTTLTPRTCFEGIFEIPPGHYMLCQAGTCSVRAYWQIPMVPPEAKSRQSVEELCEQTRELLLDAVRIRLRADVSVGSYLSGGLDSSIIAALIVNHFNNRIRTFGITFEDAKFDEGDYQHAMVQHLQCRHSEFMMSHDAIGENLAQALWHGEKPILRTSPIPMFRLSRHVREQGFKVVLSGEGADEVFGGYNIFREAKIRRFWARDPQSADRANLLGKLYPYIFDNPRQLRMLKGFFARNLAEVDSPWYSHLLRWQNTQRLGRFFSDAIRTQVGASDAWANLGQCLPSDFYQADPLARAQYLEMSIFMSNYLLSSQGDRMAMANSIEIRLPFLDHRVVEATARVPSRWKILGLREKHLLKRSFGKQLPQYIVERDKHPYRAPIRQALLQGWARDQVRALLSERAINQAGVFQVERVQKLLQKCEQSGQVSELDNMALVGILSTQSIYQQFIQDFRAGVSSLSPRPSVCIDKRLNQSKQKELSC